MLLPPLKTVKKKCVMDLEDNNRVDVKIQQGSAAAAAATSLQSV